MPKYSIFDFFWLSYFFSVGGKKNERWDKKKTKCYLTERIIQGAKTKIIISKNVKKEKFKLVGAAPVQSQENHQRAVLYITGYLVTG